MRIRCSVCLKVEERELHPDGRPVCDGCRRLSAEMTARVPELLRLLEQIELGEVTLTAVDGNVWAGNATYVASTGHKIVVFIDCGTWDYIDTIVAPGGMILWEFPDGEPERFGDAVAQYRPSREVQRDKYLVGL